MPVITRSKARASLDRQSTEVIVSPSATGQGTHTCWKYPKNRAYVQVPPLRITPAHARTESPDSSSGEHSSDTLSSLNTSDASSLTSFHTAATSIQIQTPYFPFPGTNPNPSRNPITPANTMPLTPPRHAPKKLQRSPPGQKWIQEGDGSMRMVFVPESFEMEDVIMRESILQLRLDEITERELKILQKRREAARRVGMSVSRPDSESEDEPMQGYGSGEDVEMDSDSSEGADSGKSVQLQGGRAKLGNTSRARLPFVREETEPAEEPAAVGSAGRRPLLTHNTEIFDARTTMPRRQFIR